MYYIQLLNSSVVSKQSLTVNALCPWLKVKAEQHQGSCIPSAPQQGSRYEVPPLTRKAAVAGQGLS